MALKFGRRPPSRGWAKMLNIAKLPDCCTSQSHKSRAPGMI
jgi:hypothetical protein